MKKILLIALVVFSVCGMANAGEPWLLWTKYQDTKDGKVITEWDLVGSFGSGDTADNFESCMNFQKTILEIYPQLINSEKVKRGEAYSVIQGRRTISIRIGFGKFDCLCLPDTIDPRGK